VGEFDGLTRWYAPHVGTYHEGNNPVSDELVDEVRIEFDPHGVGRVITTT